MPAITLRNASIGFSISGSSVVPTCLQMAMEVLRELPLGHSDEPHKRGQLPATKKYLKPSLR
ncbi:MAG: hypothetical protein Q9216_000803 [Gyalolechia sp. 2 TL-2023]